MSAAMDDTDSVFDLTEAIPETELLDNSIQKGRAQLSIKARRPRPSRSRYRDSVSSTEGDDYSLERKDSPLHSTRSPLHLAVRGPSPDSLLSARSPAFSFDASLGCGSPDDEGASLAAAPRGRYRQLANSNSQEALVTPSNNSPSNNSPSKSNCHSKSTCHSPDCSRVYMRRSRRPDSEVLVSSSRDSSPADSGSSTVVFDKKTKRRFLDLGVTLRRSYIRVRKDKSNRLSVGSREPSESPSRASGSFVPFSWFSEGRGSVSSPPRSPKTTTLNSPGPRKSKSQESVLSEEFSPPQTSSSTSPPIEHTHRASHPYQTLSQSSDEPFEDPSCAVTSWSSEQVCDWLKGLNMEQYVPEFSARDVDGRELLQLDGNKLKSLGVLSSTDRSALKRRIKEIQTATEKERKVLDKMERQREKQRKRKEDGQRHN